MGVVFVPGNEPPEVLEPTDVALDFPAATVARELSTVLEFGASAVAAVRTDEFNAALLQTLPQTVTVCSHIVNQVLRETAQAALVKQRFNQRDVVWAGAGDECAQRQSRGVAEDHDLGPFSSFGLADAFPPFFAEANVPSAIIWSRSIPPFRSILRNSRDQAFSQAPLLVQVSNRRQHVLEEGKQRGRSFQRAPVRSTQQMPSKQSRDSTGGRPPSGERGDSGNRSAICNHCSSLSSKAGSVVDPAGTKAASLQRDRFISDSFLVTDTHRITNVFS